MTEISTQLAKRVGLTAEYVAAINRGAAGVSLKTDTYDFTLEPETPPVVEDVWNSVCKAASHEISDGQEVRDLEWFKKNGYMLKEFPEDNWFLYDTLKEQNLRFELPYQERIFRHGQQLGNRLHEIGVNWWDTQLREYEAMPSYEPFPAIWIEHIKEVGQDPDDFPLWALTARSMQYAWGANVGIPLLREVASNVSGHKGVILNAETAEKAGIGNNDWIKIISPTGQTRGRAVLRQGIRRDTIVMLGQFDHWATPVAKDFEMPSLNSLTALALSLTDATGSSSDITRVRIERDPDQTSRRKKR